MNKAEKSFAQVGVNLAQALVKIRVPNAKSPNGFLVVSFSADEARRLAQQIEAEPDKPIRLTRWSKHVFRPAYKQIVRDLRECADEVDEHAQPTRIIFACQPVAESKAPAAYVIATRMLIEEKRREAVQILCAADHTGIAASDPEHGAVQLCPCCLEEIAGIPNFEDLRVGQTMRKIDNEWVTTDGDA